MKERRGWKRIDDRIVVVRVLNEFITSLVMANGGFVNRQLVV
jgi:hypothetical protein